VLDRIFVFDSSLVLFCLTNYLLLGCGGLQAEPLLKQTNVSLKRFPFRGNFSRDLSTQTRVPVDQIVLLTVDLCLGDQLRLAVTLLGSDRIEYD